mgnify:CR=1 FL=1
MNTIAQRITSSLIANGAKEIAVTTNHRKELSYSKQSNAGKIAFAAIKAGAKEVLIVMGCKGRNAHSANQVLVFDISNMQNTDVVNLMELVNRRAFIAVTAEDFN